MTTPRKFRVWDGSEMHEPPHDYILGSEGELYLGGRNWNTGVQSTHEVMMFTGLTDAEGTEVYEGDVVDFDSWLGVVTFGDFVCDVRGAGQKRFQGLQLRGIRKGNVYPVSIEEVESMNVIGDKCRNPDILEQTAEA